MDVAWRWAQGQPRRCRAPRLDGVVAAVPLSCAASTSLPWFIAAGPDDPSPRPSPTVAAHIIPLRGGGATSSIVYQRNKNGSVYAYRSESYRSPTTGKPTSRREYLGRVDPETGEIVPKRSRRGSATEPVAPEAPSVPEAADTRVAELEARNRELEARVEELVGILTELRAMSAAFDATIGRALEAEGT